MTSEGTAVLRHDERLSDGTPVRLLDLETLRRRTGADADDLPRVADVLADWPGAKCLNLELKVPGAARSLRTLAPLPPGVVLTSFYVAEALDALAWFPRTRVGLLVSRWPARAVPPGLALLSVREALLPEARARFPDATLWAWTVNDAGAARRAAAAGAEAWIGDDVPFLREALAGP